MPDRIIALCRPGFEKECAAELQHHAAQLGHSCYIKTSADSGYVELVFNGYGQTGAPQQYMEDVAFSSLIFCRQWFCGDGMLDDIDEVDRLGPMLARIDSMGMHFSRIEFNWPDTNEGKSISRFCKQFQPHLERALKKRGALKRTASQSLQCLWLDSCNVFIGSAANDNASGVPMGIMHLRMPSEAPSRSTLKLEEAIAWFIDDEDMRQFIKAGMRAVDLGAAPGGWSWQLARHGMLVNAVDNGPMDERLMADGMVDHTRADAFHWRPDSAVDWLVCDMVERPLHVTRLIADWFVKRLCHYSIFNLKLPMNKRFQAVCDCLQLLNRTLEEAGIRHELYAKHLYHDREEITVFCRRLPAQDPLRMKDHER